MSNANTDIGKLTVVFLLPLLADSKAPNPNLSEAEQHFGVAHVDHLCCVATCRRHHLPPDITCSTKSALFVAQ